MYSLFTICICLIEIQMFTISIFYWDIFSYSLSFLLMISILLIAFFWFMWLHLFLRFTSNKFAQTSPLFKYLFSFWQGRSWQFIHRKPCILLLLCRVFALSLLKKIQNYLQLLKINRVLSVSVLTFLVSHLFHLKSFFFLLNYNSSWYF